MSCFARTAGVGVAFLATCALIGAGDPAFAATSHGHALGHAQATTHSRPIRHAHPAPHKPADHYHGLRTGAGHALAAATARVNRIAAAEVASSVLSADDKAALATAISADLAALTADRQAVAAATSAPAIQAAMLAGVRTVQGAELQLLLVSAADQALAAATSLTTEAAALTGQAETLQAAGTDVSSVTTALDDVATQVGTVQAEAPKATVIALAIPAAPTSAQLRTAGYGARQELAATSVALAAASQDVSTATAALTALQAPTP